MKLLKYLSYLMLVLGLTYCSQKQGSEQQQEEEMATITSAPFGKLPSGEEVTSYTLANTGGISMEVITYGAIIRKLNVPDKAGNAEDVVLGFDSLKGYLRGSPYIGALVGRYGNRIANGEFSIDDETYSLAKNNGQNSLHGGVKGFDKVIWNAEEIKNDEGVGLKFTRGSPDLEEGFPGNLTVTVTYFLGNDNSLKFDYEAETDKKTVVNLTQHSYFNLSAMEENILNHELMLNASAYLPVDGNLIPTGELRPVEGTPFDFTSPKKVGAEIETENEQLGFGGGYDHNWIVNGEDGEMKLAATLYEPKSGRFMEVMTTEPGIQFYSGNFLNGANIGKGETPYQIRSGLCLETQHYPDSPNQPAFPSVVLNPGETYKTSTVYKFSTK